jgi:pimeloyl-ACP methyl ester carboxylesterase
VEPVEQWRARGRVVATPDGAVFTVQAGEGDGTPALLLHGFPTSSWDFHKIVGPLSRSRRVVAFDFLGFGLSEKPAEHGYSLFEQADLAEQVLREAGVRRAHIVAHDMGTSVATELLARRERGLLGFDVASVVLMNGSVHVELASLTLGQVALASPLGQIFARLNNRATFKLQLRRVFSVEPDEADLDTMWELLARERGVERLPQIIEYVAERRRFSRRWVGALERLDVPALVAWGKRDPVAVHAIAKQLAAEIRTATLVTWDDLGHYPQVEDPTRVAATVDGFLSRVEGDERPSSRPPPTRSPPQ